MVYLGADGFGGPLGHFSPVQTNSIEGSFETAGEPVSLPSIINPLSAELLLKMEVAWGLNEIDGYISPVETCSVLARGLVACTSARAPPFRRALEPEITGMLKSLTIAEAHEAYTLWIPTTGEPPQLLKDMEFFRNFFICLLPS